ncbi:MAG: NAD(P)-dependent oxidoreductase [Dermatophilaceae bacterium]
MTTVAVLGANGATGSEVVTACRARGYDVVAAVRRPETITEVVRTARIDLSDHDSLVAALSGADVVVSCLGHGGLKDSAKPTTLYSDSTRALRAAMRETGTRRIIVLSSAGTVQDDMAPWFYTKLLRRYLINNYLDAARMETILEESPDIEWTVVRLTYLVKGESKELRVREGQVGGGNFTIHAVDVGRFIADEIQQREWLGMHPVLGYEK